MGVNVGATSLGNKGTVAIPIRYHDASLAAVVGHLASDSSGKVCVCVCARTASGGGG